MERFVTLKQASDFAVALQDNSVREVFDTLADILDTPLQSKFGFDDFTNEQLETQLEFIISGTAIRKFIDICIECAKIEKGKELALELARRLPKKAKKYKLMHDEIAAGTADLVGEESDAAIFYVSDFHEAFLYGAHCFPGVLLDQSGGSHVPGINQAFDKIGLPHVPTLMRNSKIDREILGREFDKLKRPSPQGMSDKTKTEGVEAQSVLAPAAPEKVVPKLKLVTRDIG